MRARRGERVVAGHHPRTGEGSQEVQCHLEHADDAGTDRIRGQQL